MYEFNTNTGIIESPGYPHSYGDHESCQWYINPEGGIPEGQVDMFVDLWLHVCMCVYVYVFVCVCVCMCVYVCIYVCVCVYLCVCMYVCLCMYVCMYVVCMYTSDTVNSNMVKSTCHLIRINNFYCCWLLLFPFIVYFIYLFRIST